MNHDEIRELLSAYFDREVTERERTEVTRHLKECTDCRNRLDQMRAVKHSVREAANVELPFAFANIVSRSIHHDEEATVSWIGLEHFAGRFVIGLTLFVLLLLGITSYRQQADPLSLERYASGVGSDSAVTQLLTKQGSITRDDVMFAVLTK